MSLKSKIKSNCAKLNELQNQLQVIGNFTKPLNEITVNAPITQEKIATPSKSSQTITPDSGKYLSKVVVNPIPDQYVVPSGNKNITDTNSTDVASYATAKVVDSNLIPENIKRNVTILGVKGTYYNECTDATATSEDIVAGKTAYIGSGRITGTHVCEGATYPSDIDLDMDGTNVPYPPEEVRSLKWFITKNDDENGYFLFASLFGFGYCNNKYRCITQDGDILDNAYEFSYEKYEVLDDRIWIHRGSGTSSVTTSWNPRASNHDIFVWDSINSRSDELKISKNDGTNWY